MRATRLTSSCSALRRRGGGAAAEPFAGQKGEFPTRVYMVRGPSCWQFRVTRPRHVEWRGVRLDRGSPSRQTRSLCFRLTSSPHRLTAGHPLGMTSTPSRVENRRDRRRGLKARVDLGVASGVPVYGWPSPYSLNAVAGARRGHRVDAIKRCCFRLRSRHSRWCFRVAHARRRSCDPAATAR